MASPTSYDESARLRHYVVEHYRHLLTEDELKVCRGWLVRKKADAAGKSVRDYCEDTEAESLSAALGDDPDARLEEVAQRALRDHSDEVFINRCPDCRRIVATPKARQCLWCGHDWH